MTLMDLSAALKMDVSNFLTGSRTAKQEMESLGSSSNNLNAQLAATAQEIENANRGLMQAASNYAAAGAALTAGFTVPLVGLASEAITLAGSFQQAEIGFATMMRSAQDASAFLQELRTFAASSPFEFPELLQAARRLQAMGFEATAVIPIMRNVGDAVAGLGGGAETINRITTALGQMQAKGRVSAEEMMQLAEAGIPAWESLARAIGTSIPEAMERAKNGAITAAEAIPAILRGMQERFGGLMENQMATLSGQWSNFKDQISFLLADLGRALLPFAQMILEAAQPILGMLRSVAEGFAQLPTPVQGVIVGLAALAAAVGPVLLAFAGFTAAVSAIGTALGTTGIAGIIGALTPILGPLALAITAAGAAWAAWENIPAVSEAINGLWETLSEFWSETLAPFLETVAAAGMAFVEFAAGIASSALAAIWSEIAAAGSTLWEVIQSMAGAITPLWNAFTGLLSSLAPVLDGVLALWTGMLKLEAIFVTGALVLGWKALTTVAEAFYSVIREMASLISTAVIASFNGLAVGARTAADVFNNYMKPAIDFVIGKLRDFLGVIVELPGVKQAIEAVGGSFDNLKAKIAGSVGDAKSQIKSWSQESVSSMQAAKTAVDEAQRKYDEILRKFRDGKSTTDDLKSATDRLARAKSDFRAELDRAKPRIDAVKESLVAARREYDAAERNVRSTTLAFGEGRAKSDDLTAAHNRMRTASEAVKQATAAMEQVTRDTGVTMTQYSGGLDTVKQSLQNKTTATHSAKEALDALKASVDSAKNAYRQTYDQWQTGLATEQQVIDKHGELQAAIDRLHPERVSERQAQGHREMMERYDALLNWFTSNIPKLEALNEQLITSNARLASEFTKVHNQIAADALKQVQIKQTVSDRLSDLNDYDASEAIKAAIRVNQEVSEAYRQLGITSTAVYEEKTRKALESYNTIKNSAMSSIGDQLAAERAYLRSVVEEYQANGQQVPTAIRERLAEIERDLGSSHQRQKTKWEEFTGDLVRIGQNLNRDMASALFDVFTGQGWDSFKDAALGALRQIGEKIIEIGLDYVQGILSKHLKDIVTDIIPSLMNAFRSFGSFMVDIFRDLGSLIVSGARSAIGWITGSGSGGGGDASSAVGGAINTGAGAAAGAGGEGGMPTQVLPPIMTAFLEIRNWLSDRRQEQDIGRIEVNTRETATVLKDPNGPMHFLNTYLPKLEGIENFNYQVLAPGVAGISHEVIAKGNDTVNALNAMKNVVIEMKDSIHDIVFSMLDITTAIATTTSWLESIRNLLIDIKSAAVGVEVNTGRLDTETLESLTVDTRLAITGGLGEVGSNLLSLASNLGSSFGQSLTTAANTILGGFTTLRTEFDDIDFSDVTMALSNLTNGFSQALSSNNPAQAITSAIAQLNSNITYYGGLQYNELLQIKSRTNTAPAPVVNVSVVNTSTSISSQVRNQGLALF